MDHSCKPTLSIFEVLNAVSIREEGAIKVPAAAIDDVLINSRLLNIMSV